MKTALLISMMVLATLPGAAQTAPIPGTSSISGRVLAADGEPIIGTVVSAAEPSYIGGTRQLDRGARAATDDQGRYRIFGLLPGEYYLQARYTPVYPGLESRQVSFPGTFDERAAKPVSVPAGAELTGMDFVFPAPSIVPTYTITGTLNGVPPVTDRNSAPTVRLVPRDPRFDNNSVRVRANGQFQIRGVRAGMYDLYSVVEDEKRALYTSKTPIEVLNSIEDLHVTMQPGVDVRVRITVNGLPPGGVFEDEVPGLEPLSGVMPSYYSELFYSLDGYKGDKNSGDYVLPHVPPGQYRLNYSANTIENGYISDIKQNGRSIFDEGLTVGNRSPDPVEIAIAAPGGIVEGVVRDSRGNPVPPARVVVVPLLARRNNRELYRMGGSDENGEFRIRGVAPGAYKVFALADPPLGEPWWNAEYMAQHEQHGQPVQVEANTVVSVRVMVIPKAGP